MNVPEIESILETISQREKEWNLSHLDIDDIIYKDSALSAAAEKAKKEGRENNTSNDKNTVNKLSFGTIDIPLLLRNEASFTVVSEMLIYGGVAYASRKELWKSNIHWVIVHLLDKLLDDTSTTPVQLLHSDRFNRLLWLFVNYYLIYSADVRRMMIAKNNDDIIDIIGIGLGTKMVRQFIALITVAKDEYGLSFDGEQCFRQWLPIEDTNSISSTNSGTLEESVVKHVGISCKSCLMEPIVGPRYTCTVCTKLNLCNTCYNTKHFIPYNGRLHYNKGHEMKKIVQPLVRTELPVWITILERLCYVIQNMNIRVRKILLDRSKQTNTTENDANSKESVKFLTATSFLELIRTETFCSSIIYCINVGLEVATNTRQFDVKRSERSALINAALNLLGALSSDAEFVQSLTQNTEFTSFLLQSLCHPASMADSSISITNLALRILLNMVSINSSTLVHNHHALLWLNPLLFHPRPYISLKAAVIVGIILHLTENVFTSSETNKLAYQNMEDIKTVFRTYAMSECNLGTLSEGLINVFVDMIITTDQNQQESSAASSKLSTITKPNLQLIGLGSLVMLVNSGLGSADWHILQNLSPSFYKQLALFCSDSTVDRFLAYYSLTILKALGHTIPSLHQTVSTLESKSTKTTAKIVSFSGLDPLLLPLDEWNTDTVCLWISLQSFNEYTSLCRSAWINGRVLQQLTDTDLVEMGIAKAIHRKVIKVAINNLITLTSSYERHKSKKELLHNLGVFTDTDTVNTDRECDIYVVTPTRGSFLLCSFLVSQLQSLGLRLGGSPTGKGLIGTISATTSESIEESIVQCGYGGVPAEIEIDTTAVAETNESLSITKGNETFPKLGSFINTEAINNSVRQSNLCIVFLSPSSLILSDTVIGNVATMPMNLSTRLHSLLVAELSAIIRSGRPLLVIATDTFEWPADNLLEPEIRELRAIVEPLPNPSSPDSSISESVVPPPVSMYTSLETLPHVFNNPSSRNGMFIRLSPFDTLIYSQQLAKQITEFVLSHSSNNTEG